MSVTLLTWFKGQVRIESAFLTHVIKATLHFQVFHQDFEVWMSKNDKT